MDLLDVVKCLKAKTTTPSARRECAAELLSGRGALVPEASHRVVAQHVAHSITVSDGGADSPAIEGAERRRDSWDLLSRAVGAHGTHPTAQLYQRALPVAKLLKCAAADLRQHPEQVCDALYHMLRRRAVGDLASEQPDHQFGVALVEPDLDAVSEILQASIQRDQTQHRLFRLLVDRVWDVTSGRTPTQLSSRRQFEVCLELVDPVLRLPESSTKDRLLAAIGNGLFPLESLSNYRSDGSHFQQLFQDIERRSSKDILDRSSIDSAAAQFYVTQFVKKCLELKDLLAKHHTKRGRQTPSTLTVFFVSEIVRASLQRELHAPVIAGALKAWRSAADGTIPSLSALGGDEELKLLLKKACEEILRLRSGSEDAAGIHAMARLDCISQIVQTSFDAVDDRALELLLLAGEREGDDSGVLRYIVKGFVQSREVESLLRVVEQAVRSGRAPYLTKPGSEHQVVIGETMREVPPAWLAKALISFINENTTSALETNGTLGLVVVSTICLWSLMSRSLNLLPPLLHLREAVEVLLRKSVSWLARVSTTRTPETLYPVLELFYSCAMLSIRSFELHPHAEAESIKKHMKRLRTLGSRLSQLWQGSDNDWEDRAMQVRTNKLCPASVELVDLCSRSGSNLKHNARRSLRQRKMRLLKALVQDNISYSGGL